MELFIFALMWRNKWLLRLLTFWFCLDHQQVNKCWYHLLSYVSSREQFILWAAPRKNKMICAPSEDSDQPAHPPSLIRVLARRSNGSQVPKAPSCGQRWLIRLDGCPGWVFAGRTCHFVGFVVLRLKFEVYTYNAAHWYWCALALTHVHLYVQPSFQLSPCWYRWFL